jgi:hypothetical protein
MPEPRHLIVLAVAIAGALSLYGGLISRKLATPAQRRRLTATGIAQLVLAFSFFLPVGAPSLIFQALLVLAILLIALKIPRGFFAEPTHSK